MATRKELDQVRARTVSLLRKFESLEAAASSLLENLGSAYRCGWMALWKAQPDTNSLHVLTTWQPSPERSAELKDFTLHWEPSLGEGMVGKAWRTLRTQHSENVVQDMVLPRSLLAKSAGIAGGLWIPIRARRTGFVLECLWASKQDPSLTGSLESLAEPIAEFVDRKA